MLFKCSAAGVVLIVACLRDIVICYNVDVNYPILYKGPNNSYFGYSISLHSGIRDNWLQVGAPKSTNARIPLVKSPGSVFRCPFKQTCRPHEIDFYGNENGERKDGSWLGGSMDIDSGSGSYAVCSHRRINEKWKGLYYMTGACYWGRTRENLRPRKLVPLEGYETFTLATTSPTAKPIVVYDWGNGLAGISTHIPKVNINEDLQLVIGAPGVFNLRGAAILYSDMTYGNKKPVVTNPYKNTVMTKDDDYVGYQVSSGYFFNANKLLYVASAPRASGYKGKVMVFEFPNRTREAMVIRQELVGETIGEYFGASLASGDLDGDHLDDLVVGAPQWSAQEDEGRVYVYSGSTKGKMTHPIIFEGPSKGAMFGYAVQILGDIDYDGFNDLAVGAPYADDGHGAVYVYYGGTSGLSTARSTKIVASKLSHQLRGFGVSFSKAEDMDKNGYGDFAVGSFISGHAVLLRSRPVIDIVVSLMPQGNSLDHSATQFNVNLCIMYTGHAVPSSLVFERRLSADIAFERVTLSNTGKADDTTDVQVMNDSMSCETLSFSLRPKNNYDPLEITASYSLKSGSNDSHALIYGDQLAPGSDRFCSTCPVLRLGSRTRASTTISFASNCGNDGECTSDLQVTGFLNGTTNGAYVLGSDKSVALEVEIHNAGESAYLTQLFIQIPKPVDLESIPSTCQQEDMNDENIALTCFVANPLYNDKKHYLLLPLDMSKVGVSDASQNVDDNYLEFNVTATTISSNVGSGNHTKLLRMDLKAEFDITVTGKTPQDALSYDSPDNGTVVETLRFQHNFAVQKFGASPVHEAFLEILLPYSMTNGEGQTINFLQVHSIARSQDGQPFQCTHDRISYQVDSEYSTDDLDFDSYEDSSNETANIISPSHIRRTRQVTVEEPPQNRTLHLNCNSHLISCYSVKCFVGPFIHEQTVARVSIEMSANASALRDLLDTRDLALFSSSAHVEVTRPAGLNQSPVGGVTLRPDDFVLSTLFIGTPKSGTIAMWIIALSVIVGLLLLSLLIVGLVKAGFFKRKAKEELEALKEAEQVPIDRSEEEALNNTENLDKEDAT